MLRIVLAFMVGIVAASAIGGYAWRHRDDGETVTGSGKAAVRVSNTLDARIEGSGVIDYIGSPTVTQQVEGLGAIRQIES
jgi:hypothetical protein